MSRLAKRLYQLLRRSLHERPEVVQSNRQLLPHVRALFAVSETADCAKASPVVFGHLLCLAADFYVHEQRDRQSTLGMPDMAAQLPLPRTSEDVASPEAVLLAARLESLRCVYWEVLAGDIERANQHLRNARSLCVADPVMHAELLHIAGNLACKQGLFDEGRRLMEEGLEAKSRQPDCFSNAAVAYSKHGLARLYSGTKQRALAEATYEHAIRKKITCYGHSQHIDVAPSQARFVEHLLQQPLSTEVFVKVSQMMDNVMKVFTTLLDKEQYEVRWAKRLRKSDAWETDALQPPIQSAISLAPCVLTPSVRPRLIGGPHSRYYSCLDDVPAGTRNFMER
jgi:hypothetical protein